jgi:hypothetical protein
MIPAEISVGAARLERLLAERRFSEACQAVEDYGRALEQVLRTLPPGDPLLTELAAAARQTWESARRRALTGRAHAAARLVKLLKMPGAYRSAPRAPRTWEFMG